MYAFMGFGYQGDKDGYQGPSTRRNGPSFLLLLDNLSMRPLLYLSPTSTYMSKSDAVTPMGRPSVRGGIGSLLINS